MSLPDVFTYTGHQIRTVQSIPASSQVDWDFAGDPR